MPDSRQSRLFIELLDELSLRIRHYVHRHDWRIFQEILQELKKIAEELSLPQTICRFTVTQQGDSMALLPIAPGNSPVFTATPVPSTSVPATPPTWTTSDPVNAPISVDPTGLVATVNIPTSATVGDSFVLTISYTNADGTVATGSTSQTIVAAPSPDITSFTIEQTT